MDKISNQNFFQLVNSLNKTNPKRFEELINLNCINFNNDLNFKNTIRKTKKSSNINIKNLSENEKNRKNDNLTILEFEINFLKFNSLFKKNDKSKVNRKIQYVLKRKRANFLSAKIQFKIEDKKTSNYSESESEDEEANNILQSLQEISLPNNIRSKIKDIANNKSIKEYFPSKQHTPKIENMSEEISENLKSNVNIKNKIMESFEKDIKKDKNISQSIKFDFLNNNLIEEKINIFEREAIKGYNHHDNKKNLNFEILKKDKHESIFFKNNIFDNKQLIKNKNLKEKEDIRNKALINFIERQSQNKIKFMRVFRNFYSFNKIFFDYKYLENKLKNLKDLNIKFNQLPINLFYSNIIDEFLYVDGGRNNKLDFLINKNLESFKNLLEEHTGINLYLNKYNKITKRRDFLISNTINNRRLIINKLLNKEKSLIEEKELPNISYQDNRFMKIDKKITNNYKFDFDRFEVIKGQKLIFYANNNNFKGNVIPCKFNLITKYNKAKNIKFNKKIYEGNIMKLKLENFVKNSEKITINKIDKSIINMKDYEKPDFFHYKKSKCEILHNHLTTKNNHLNNFFEEQKVRENNTSISIYNKQLHNHFEEQKVKEKNTDLFIFDKRLLETCESPEISNKHIFKEDSSENIFLLLNDSINFKSIIYKKNNLNYNNIEINEINSNEENNSISLDTENSLLICENNNIEISFYHENSIYEYNRNLKFPKIDNHFELNTKINEKLKKIYVSNDDGCKNLFSH